MTPARTLREFRLLGREWLSLWWQFLPALGFWFCVGRIGLELGALGATFLRPDTGPGAALAAVGIPTRVVATLVFILGLIVHVVCLVMMIASTGAGLRSARDPHLRSAVPGQFTEHRTRRDIIVETVAPFLAVYALGGFAEEQVRTLFQANLVTHGLDADGFTINFSQWQVYLAMAGVSWLLLAGVEFVGRRRPSVGLTLLGLVAKGTLVLSAFIAFNTLGVRFQDWITPRVAYGWWMDAWEAFLSWLPDWHIWFNVTIPDAVREASVLLWSTFIPGLVDSIVLPLFWLALTATVFGWHDFSAGVAASRREAALLRRARRASRSRVGIGVQDAVASGPLRAGWNFLRSGAEDFLPTVQAFRLIVRSGPRFIGVHLVFAAIAATMHSWLFDGVQYLIGPRSFAVTIAYHPTLSAAVDLIATTLSVALYAAAFDRCLASATARTPQLQSARGQGRSSKPGSLP